MQARNQQSKPSESDVVDAPIVKATIVCADGDHNFDYTIQQKPTEFVHHIRQQGGYYVPATRRTANGEEIVTGVVFVPWHQIHYIRFEEEE